MPFCWHLLCAASRRERLRASLATCSDGLPPGSLLWVGAPVLFGTSPSSFAVSEFSFSRHSSVTCSWDCTSRGYRSWMGQFNKTFCPSLFLILTVAPQMKPSRPFITDTILPSFHKPWDKFSSFTTTTSPTETTECLDFDCYLAVYEWASLSSLKYSSSDSRKDSEYWQDVSFTEWVGFG